MASVASPNRRVLSEKSTNTHLSIQEHAHASKGTPTSTKAVHHIISPRAGSKRRFHEIDLNMQGSPHNKDVQHEKACAEVDSFQYEIEETDEDSSVLLSSFMDSNATTASSGSLCASANTVLTSFHASQEPSQPIEEQFEIVQEESQRTLEQIHATPMPELKLSLPPSDRPALQTELSQESLRLSSFIEFDEAEENQREKKDDDMEMIVPLRIVLDDDANLKSAQLFEKVSMLRIRLQLAMHKVETKQTSKPFSRLDKPKSLSPELNLPPRIFTAKDQTHGIRNSPESQIAAKRARAFRGGYMIKPVQRLSSLPVPTIIPTAYSARYMNHLEDQSMHQQYTSISQSSLCNSRNGEQTVFRVTKTRATPSPLKTRTKAPLPETPINQRSSSPGSGDGESARRSRRSHTKGRSALTSSVVKGEAANGLLELLRAGSQ